MALTTSSADIELLAADGVTPIPLSVVAIRDAKGNLVGRQWTQTLAAAQSDSPLGEWIEPKTEKDWFGGVGISYSQAAAVYTRTPGSAIPAGYVTQTVIPPGGSNTPIVAFEEFGGDLFAAEEGDAGTGGRVLRLVGGTGTNWVDSGAGLVGGDVIRDLIVFDDGAGTNRLYFSYTTPGFGSGQLKYWNGAAWSAASGLFVGNTARGRMRREFWVIDGVGAWRIIAISGGNTIAYTRPNADPMLPASWVEGVKIVTDSYLDELAGARRHVWIGSKTDVHDLTENGDSPGLMGYQNRTPTGIRFPLQYLDGYVYRAGANTLDRIRVDEGAVLQENPGNCAPGYGTRARNQWRGYPTALCVEQGYLVCAVWNPTTGRTGIFWGKDRQTVGIASANPLIWYGPEIVSASSRQVTKMAPSMLAGDRRLWIASLAGTTPEIVWASLPVAGAPIEDIISGGTHRFTLGDGAGNWNATSELWSLPEDWDDPVALKINDANGLNTAGLSHTDHTQIVVYNRVDPTPGSVDWGSGIAYDVSPVESGGIPSVQSGYLHEYRCDFGSPLGNSTPPQVGELRAIRRTAWRRAASFMVLTLDVEFGPGVGDIQNGNDTSWSPDRIIGLLKQLTDGDKTTLRTRDDQDYTVILRQALTVDEALLDGAAPYGKRGQARLVLALLAGPL